MTLATIVGRSRLAEEGRALFTARQQHMTVDSPPPLGGPNESLNPVEMLVGALATCGTFVMETAARELGLDLEQATVTVEADFDPEGVRTGSCSPAIQAWRVHAVVDGVTSEELEQLAAAYRIRCPVFTTVAQAAPIAFTYEAA